MMATYAQDIEYRAFEFDDCKKIMKVDWSNRVENCYEWRDGELTVVKEDPVYVGPDLTVEEKKTRKENAERHFHKPEAIRIGAFCHDDLAGYVCMNILGYRGKYEEAWHLWQLVVSQPYRRRRIATELFTLAKQKATEVSQTKNCLLATYSEEAIRFYLSVGFIPFEEPPEIDHWSYWNGNDIYLEMKL